MPFHRVTAHVLNLRAGPGTSFEILNRLPHGTRVESTEVSENSRWVRVRAELWDGMAEGWVSARYLSPDEPPPDDLPLWFRIGSQEVGVQEYEGPEHNPRILEYHQTTTLKATEDEVPWCSAFVNWCITQAGLTGTDDALARSWMEWGSAIPVPRQGCLVVFSRPPDPRKGHVAFFVQEAGAFHEVLGGNQSNQVKISRYHTGRVLGYRWPL